MGTIRIPAAPQIMQVKIPTFYGADLTNQPSYINVGRSPECPNMIRESTGKVRKWVGWHTVKQFDGQINGFHQYVNADGVVKLIHAGTKLINYDTDEVYVSDMADNRSVSKQLDGKLLIADGKKIQVFYQKETEGVKQYVVEDLSANAYVPTIVISRSPNGGGTTYEAINLVGKARTDSFLGTATDKVYQLSATEIDGVTKVEKLKADATWEEITAYTVDNTTGKVTFSTAPGVSVVTGQDNVKITYEKTNSEYPDRINKCDIMTMYGIDGLTDRIFVAGNPEYPNRDYYCQMDNPTYWGDINYSVIGADKSSIVGYSVINNTLATHLDRSDTDTNIVLRQGVLTDKGEPAFRIVNAYQGTGAISKYCFNVLETEPLFLTRDGIMAVTPSDVIGERYAQLRSYFLNGLLLKQNLKEAVSCTFDRFYMLAVGGYIFALDGTQASAESNAPYSKRQYAAFYRTNVPRRVIANLDNVLTFGTEDGRVCEFYTDYNNINNFNDDGQAINAYWTTPEIYGNHFYYKKRFKLLAAMLGSAVATGVQVKAKYDGIEETVIEYSEELKHFSFSGLSFSKFTFKTDDTAQIIREKISVKPDDRKVQFIFQNDILNEPFALYEATIEYTESR